jgi:hypothetical protein
MNGSEMLIGCCLLSGLRGVQAQLIATASFPLC